jgi:hypothetical protein
MAADGSHIISDSDEDDTRKWISGVPVPHTADIDPPGLGSLPIALLRVCPCVPRWWREGVGAVAAATRSAQQASAAAPDARIDPDMPHILFNGQVWAWAEAVDKDSAGCAQISMPRVRVRRAVPALILTGRSLSGCAIPACMADIAIASICMTCSGSEVGSRC